MKPPDGSPDWLDVFTAAERPDLWHLARDKRVFEDVWPTYNNHGNNTGRYFSSLFPKHADLQILFVDRRSERLIARGRTIPVEWDRSMEHLPAGIDEAGLRAIEESCSPNALSALAAEVHPDYQGSGLSILLIASMSSVARLASLEPLIAPVRPSWKDRYPLIAIEDYATWVRHDGLPFDPWMRVHARLGARILRPEPRSLEITAPVDDWQTWTGMEFPQDGSYIFPAGLAPVDVRDGVGLYFEPNVWMLHEVGG
jgi:hypothetical protein